MENLEEIQYLAGTQTIADRETLCHNATKAFSLSELESIRLMHFLLFFCCCVKFLFFPSFWPVRVKEGMNLRNVMWHGLRNDIIMGYVIYTQ